MRIWLGVALVALSACSGRRGDPPPPAASAIVPQAPPNALGAMAAGKAPEPSLSAPESEWPSDEVPPTPPLTPAPGGGYDAGVSL